MFRLWGLGFGVWGFRVEGLGFRVPDAGFRFEVAALNVVGKSQQSFGLWRWD